MSRVGIIVNYLVLISFSLISSCSSVTKNMVKVGELGVPGGVVGDREWKDVLTFKRVSWFKELTLTYDALYTPIDSKSPFYAWFSAEEKEKVDSCQEVWLFYSYTIDSRRVSDHDLIEQLEAQGFEEFSIDHFHGHMKMHANFEYLSMQVYTHHALCRNTANTSKVRLAVPGFKVLDL